MKSQATSPRTRTRKPGASDRDAQRSVGGRWLILATLCTAVLIVQLDTAIVNLAVRPIGSYFKASVGAMQWVVDGYNFVYAVFLLTGGLLADLYGRRRLFMAGATVFTLASVLCAIAPSIPVLIVGRTFAGLGAALLLPASLAIIRVVWPEPVARGRALGVWASCNGLALAIGPTVGGVLVGAFGWRSIFLVVVPLGTAGLLLAIACVPESRNPHGRRFDIAGQMLGALALGGLTFAAIESQHWPIAALVALVICVLAFACFLVIESKAGAAAMIPLDLFKAPTLRGAMTATVGMTFGMYGVLFLLPLTWQSEGLLGPVGAGIALMPMALTFVLVSFYSGALNARLDTRFMAGGGVAVIGSGLLVIGVTAPYRTIAGAEIGLVLTGLGMGLATGPLMGAAVDAVSAARSGTASALINVARMAGATLGVAALGAVFAWAGRGTSGLRLAMLCGGGVQLAGAATAWFTMKPRAAQQR